MFNNPHGKNYDPGAQADEPIPGKTFAELYADRTTMQAEADKIHYIYHRKDGMGESLPPIGFKNGFHEAKPTLLHRAEAGYWILKFAMGVTGLALISAGIWFMTEGPK